VNRSSAQQGNPNRAGLSQSETRARGPTDSQGRPIKIPDRAFVERYSKTVRPECDQPESPSDDAEVRIGRGLKYPKDKGYGKFLETLGYDRNWAGMLAARIVEEGRFQAATARKNSEFAQALRRLAKRRLGPCSSRRARRGTCSGRCRASRTARCSGREIVPDLNVAPNHGWRHRFKTVGMEAGIPPRILDAIQGHAPRTAAEGCGEVTVKAMAQAMERVPRVEV
jgi:hypothetical protein